MSITYDIVVQYDCKFHEILQSFNGSNTDSKVSNCMQSAGDIDAGWTDGQDRVEAAWLWDSWGTK